MTSKNRAAEEYMKNAPRGLCSVLETCHPKVITNAGGDKTDYETVVLSDLCPTQSVTPLSDEASKSQFESLCVLSTQLLDTHDESDKGHGGSDCNRNNESAQLNEVSGNAGAHTDAARNVTSNYGAVKGYNVSMLRKPCHKKRQLKLRKKRMAKKNAKWVPVLSEAIDDAYINGDIWFWLAMIIFTIICVAYYVLEHLNELRKCEQRNPFLKLFYNFSFWLGKYVPFLEF